MKALLILSLLCAPSMANPCRVRQRVIVQEVIAVPVAVPVGVPVASVVPNMPLYSASGYAAQPQDAEWAEFQAWRAAKVKAQAVPQSMLTQKCAACHGEASTNAGARAKLKLESMTSDDRIDAVRALWEQRMPPSAKKTQLGAEIVGLLVGELSDRPKAEKPKEVPPPANPPQPKE